MRCVIAWICAAVCGAGCAGLALEYRLSRLRVAFALDQVGIFEQSVEKAGGKGEDERAAIRKYVRAYYPSGTKQAEGSDLDAIVEGARKLALRALGDEVRQHKRN
jgi:protoporphyrinogen oxidase